MKYLFIIVILFWGCSVEGARRGSPRTRSIVGSAHCGDQRFPVNRTNRLQAYIVATTFLKIGAAFIQHHIIDGTESPKILTGALLRVSSINAIGGNCMGRVSCRH